MHYFLKFIFGIKTLHVSDSSSAHHQEFFHCTHSNGICHTACAHLLSLCVQLKIPDDGQRNCPKHVEFYSKNKFWEISASSWFYYKNSNYQSGLFSKKNPIIRIFYISGWFGVPINPDKRSSAVSDSEEGLRSVELVPPHLLRLCLHLSCCLPKLYLTGAVLIPCKYCTFYSCGRVDTLFHTLHFRRKMSRNRKKRNVREPMFT